MKFQPWSTGSANQVLATLKDEPGATLLALQTLQIHFGYINKEAVGLVADFLNVSRAEVHGVLTFYHDLRTSPPADHDIQICVAEACQALGARELAAEAKEKFKSEVKDAFCFGNCALSPAAMVDGALIGRATISKIADARK